MNLNYPKTAMTGKNGKVLISSGDGAKLTSEAMTLQAAYTLEGETLTNQVYLLGTGKTLINMRPAAEPRVDIDGIIDGLEITPDAANDKVDISAGSILVDGTVVAVVATDAEALSRPAATQGCWNAIHVHKATGAVSVTKGEDTTDAQGKTSLLDTWGAAAGQRPLIPVTDLLIGLVKLINGTALVVPTEIFYYDRETSDIEAEILPNIGGCKIPTALVKLHAGALGRTVKFTGYYLDNALAEIATAKKWGLTPANNTVSDTTFGKSYSKTEISGWGFTFEQLHTDGKVISSVLDRQGYCAIKLMYPNGGFWQGAATLVPNFVCDPASFQTITVSGSMLDTPAVG